MSLTDVELQHLADQYHVKLNGIYCKDEIPHTLHDGWYIINMQNAADGNGTHWECMKWDHNKPCVYMDSFGFLPSTEIIACFPHGYIYNQQQIQDIDSNNCGLYCIATMVFWKSVAKQGISDTSIMKSYQSMFSSHTKLNGIVLKQYLHEM